MSDLQNNQPVGHEEANLRIMADAMGPELANLAFETKDGQGFFEKYGNKTELPENLTQYTQQQGGQTTMGQGGQFSGYGSSNPQYGQGQNVNIESQEQGRQQFYNGQTQLPQNLTQGQGIQQGQGFQQGQSYQQQLQGQAGGMQGQFGGNGAGVQGGGYQEWRVSSGGQATSDYYSRLPKVFNKAIVAVRKDGRGDILAFQLEDGTVLDYAQMLKANEQGGFQGLRVQGNREGELIIRSVPDGFTDNNLDNLPQF